MLRHMLTYTVEMLHLCCTLSGRAAGHGLSGSDCGVVTTVQYGAMQTQSMLPDEGMISPSDVRDWGVNEAKSIAIQLACCSWTWLISVGATSVMIVITITCAQVLFVFVFVFARRIRWSLISELPTDPCDHSKSHMHHESTISSSCAHLERRHVRHISPTGPVGGPCWQLHSQNICPP